MNKEKIEKEEYLKELDLKLSEKDMILNRNIEYSFILEQEISTLKKETNTLNQIINSKEQEVKTLKQKINSKEQEVKTLKQKIKAKEKTISKFKNENELIKSTISWRITKPLRYIRKLIK